MYGNSYYNNQVNLDRINNQINELEKIRSQLQQPLPQPTNLTQNFQLTPNVNPLKYATSMDEVKRENVNSDTPYFSKDMSVVWIKSTKGDIKTYELTEIIPKDEKDLKIEYLQLQIEQMKKGMMKDESNSNIDESDSDATQSE
jgi:hypothetical protein